MKRESILVIITAACVGVLSSSCAIQFHLKGLEEEMDESAIAVGELYPWSTDAELLPAPRSQLTTVEVNGRLYALGGDQGGGTGTSETFYADMRVDGSLGPWTTSPELFPIARERHGSFTLNGYLYVIGGNAAGNGQSTVFVTSVNGDGSIAPWAFTTSLPGGRRRHTTLVHNGYVYVMGGSNPGFDTVYTAKPNPDGTISFWSLDPTPLPEGMFLHASVLHAGSIYILGGYRNGWVTSDAVYRSVLNADGTLGAWETIANSLPQHRAEHQAFVKNGYIFVAGGLNYDDGPLDSIYSAKIKTDGSLSNWHLTNSSLPEPRFLFSTLVGSNGTIYSVAGRNAANGVTDQIFRTDFRL